MLRLAEWVMRGRWQACLFVLLGLATSPLIWFNNLLVAAVIALVWLRQGLHEGLLILGFTVLPASILAVTTDSFMPLLLALTISIAAWTLRETRSWSGSLLAICTCGLFAAIFLQQFADTQLHSYVDLYAQFLSDLKQQVAKNSGGEQAELHSLLPQAIEIPFVAGLFGSMTVICSFLSLSLARSWQAKLYNPNGFQQEFHALRAGKTEVIMAVLLTGLFYQLGLQYLTWVWIALFPLLVAGIALFHAVAFKKKVALPLYGVFYVVLTFWDPLKILLVLLAIADSGMNFREKITAPPAD